MQQDSLSKPHHSTISTTASKGAGYWTVAWAWYCLLIHFLVFAFPMRSCWAMIDMTQGLQKMSRSKSLKDFKLSHRRRGSSTSLSSSETLTSSKEDSLPSSATSSEAGDIETEFYTDGDAEPERVIHAIIIPNYKEEVDSLRETLDVLACHPQAQYCYDVSSFFLFFLFLLFFSWDLTWRNQTRMRGFAQELWRGFLFRGRG